MIKFIFILLLINMLFTVKIYGQVAITASGQEANGIGGSSSATIGEVFYHFYADSTYKMNHGVQQPYEIWVINHIPEANQITLNMIAFPNPTTDILYINILQMDNMNLSNLKVRIFDSKGKFLDHMILNNNLTKIDLKKYSKGMYFFDIIQENRTIKSFKIIKN